MENLDFQFSFPDLSTLSLNGISDYDRELTALLTSFEFSQKPGRTLLSDRKNTLVPAVERPEEKSKARFAPPTSSQEVASVSTPFVPRLPPAKHNGV